MKNIQLFIQLEKQSENTIRYAFAGYINEKKQATGLVFGYEGGGIYSESLIVNDQYVTDYIEEIDDFIEWDDRVAIFEELTEKGLYEKCDKELNRMANYDLEVYTYNVKPEYQNLFHKTEVHSELPDNVTPPSYCNTYWEIDNTTILPFSELKKVYSFEA